MTLVPMLAALTVAGAVVCFILAMVGRGEREQALERLLGAHGVGAPGGGSSFQQMSVALRRRSMSALPVLNALLARSEWAERVALDLERAELRLKVGEYLLIRGLFAFLAGMVTLLLSQVLLLGLVVGVAAYFLPPFYLRRRRQRRMDRLDRQLPEFLTLVSNALKAGFGLMQGLDNAADQLDPPISVELRRTLRDIAIGASVEDALTALNDRVGSKDLDIVVTAILVQRTAGGNLSEVLDTTAHTIRERDRIKGEIKTLTSQQMLTGYVLGVLPVGMAVLLAVISREYMEPLFSTTLGHMLIAGAVVMDIIGFVVIRKILNIEV